MDNTLPGRISRGRHDHLLLLGLNRVVKRNTFDLPVLDGLVTAFGEYEADGKLCCALLFVHGKHFAAGLDLASVDETFRQGWKPPEGAVDPWGTFGGRHPSKPLVVAVQDYCHIIGIELILAADINLYASSARFAQLGVQRGILPFSDAALHMHQITDWGNAMRWLLTDNKLDTHEAYRLGLVQEVTAPEDLLDRAVALAERVAAQAPLGVRATLGSTRQALLEDEAVAVAALPEAARRLLDGKDARKGLYVLQERHPGRFEGRQAGPLSVRLGYWAGHRLSIQPYNE